MAYTENTYIPSLQELTVPEIKLTTGPLLAASLYLGKYCDEKCKEFMLCYQETFHNPVICLNEGKEVTACGIEFFKKLKEKCPNEFSAYHFCLDKRAGPSDDLNYCRKKQSIFDKCMEERMGIARPEYGYFARVRLHKTNRPRFEIDNAPMPTEIPDAPDNTTNLDPDRIQAFVDFDDLLGQINR